MKKYFSLLLLMCWCGTGMAQKKELTPVIIIMADQLRWDVPAELTPHINALKKDGVNFTRAYCAVPLCAPSRASFFTGLYANRTGSLINPWEEEDEKFGNTRAGIPSLYSMLEKDWDSYHVGKQHFFTEEKADRDPKSKTKWITQQTYSDWIKDNKKTKPGGKQFKDNAPELISGEHTRLRSYSTPVFDVYKDGIDYFLDHYIASESIAAIKNRDRKKPLLLNAMFLAPHPPFSIPEPYYSMISPGDFTLPENVGQWYFGQSPLQMYSLTGFIGSRYSRQQWAEIWAKYLGLVKLLDDEVGRVINALKEEGLYDKSIIVFTADHGEMLGSHSLWQKMCMYEESAKVPLVVKLPKSFQTSVKASNALVSLVDVLPTLLEYNKLPLPQKLDGRSLMPLIEGKASGRNSIFIQYDGNGSLASPQRCVVKNNYKLIVDMFKDEAFIELYDVIKDPQEKVNLAFDKNFAATADDLIAELSAYMQSTGDRVQLPKDLRQNFLKQYKKGIEKSDKSR